MYWFRCQPGALLALPPEGPSHCFPQAGDAHQVGKLTVYLRCV